MTITLPDGLPPIVVKIGGARAVNPEGALSDVAALIESGSQIIVVHGGSTAVDETLEQLGEEPEYVETPSGVVGRFTDEETMDVFSMVLPGKLNTDLVVALQNEGVNSVGLSGVDGGLLTGTRKSAVRVVEDGRKKIRRGDHSGRIESVNSELLETLLSAGYTPVVTVPMLADDGVAVNSDADRAAAAVAGAVSGELVLLTDVSGVLSDLEDESSVIERVETPEEYEQLTDAAEGFMSRKVMAATEALDGGATRATIAGANSEEPIQSAIEQTNGTTITPEAVQ